MPNGKRARNIPTPSPSLRWQVQDIPYLLTIVNQMNTALKKAGSEWRYELTGELPTLKKQ